MSKILHLSYDLRDRFNRDITTAVKNLIKITSEINEIEVIDLVRVSKIKNEFIHADSPNHLKVNCYGLPYGIFHLQSQKRAFNKIMNASGNGLIDLNSISLVHSHKLTFEGYIGYLISKELCKPLIITLRQTDTIVLSKRKDLVSKFKNVLEYSSKIIYLIPNMIKELRKIIDDNFFNMHIEPKLQFLPNMVERKISKEGVTYTPDTFLTILRMTKESVLRKNIKNLLKALIPLKQSYIKLKIIGEGEYLWKVKKWVEEFGLKNNVEFIGNILNEEIDKYYAEAEAFLLPSKSESFGMVYAESLLNGTPIMYSKNVLGFDGVFENVGVGVYPNSIESITEGIKTLQKNNLFFRSTISNLRESNALNIFSSGYIKEIYSNIVREITV